MSIRVSVVLPTYRRPQLLDRCLDALLEQDLCAQHYELIVVDDAASDETRCQVERRACEAARTKHTLRYLCPLSGHGPAAARNAGWRAAVGAVIAFTDDDCMPEPGWLRAGLAAIEAGADGASGRLIVPLKERPTDYERDARNLESAEFVTANCFYCREALAAADGFDERFPVAWREDTDLQFRLLALGARLVRAPDAVVTHPVRPASWGVSLRQQRKSMYNALLYKKHPALYRERIQATPPWRYYLIAATALAALAFSLRGRSRLALIALCLWSVLTGRFCVSRLGGTSRRPAHIAEMIVTSVAIPPLSIFWRLRGAVKYHVLFF